MRFSLDQLNAMLEGGMAVYRHYYPLATGLPFKEALGTKIISPFNRNGKLEDHPSFSMFFNRLKGTVFFKDHGLEKVGTHWQFVMDLYSIDFKEAIEKVKRDVLNLNGESVEEVQRAITYIKTAKPKQKSGRTGIIPTYRNFTDEDFAWFGKAKISPKTLALFKTTRLMSFELVKEDKTIWIGDHGRPMYAFEINGRFKIYKPFEENRAFKWTSNLIAEEDIFGFDLLPGECEHLFFIGGNRDAMAFYENLGYPVIALASESANLPENVFHRLKYTGKHMWALYDNDEQGRKKAAKFKEMYGIQPLNHLYEPFGVKDLCQLTERNVPGELEKFAFFLDRDINKMNIA
jgi:hypothetical protein